MPFNKTILDECAEKFLKSYKLDEYVSLKNSQKEALLDNFVSDVYNCHNNKTQSSQNDDLDKLIAANVSSYRSKLRTFLRF